MSRGNKGTVAKQNGSSLGEQEPKNLRDLVKQNSECEKKFFEAEKLALGIHEGSSYVPLPYFTQHGINHCKKLEEFANKIIWRFEQFSKNEFQPNPEEAMYLLSAIWLHDIGMMYGIFDGEKPEDLKDEAYAARIREEHEIRTVKYIHRKWKLNCTWSEDQRVLLGNICYFHRKKHPIAEFAPVIEKSSYGYDDIRLAILASLIRLIDGCHVDQSRAPMALLGLYRSVGMSVSHALHWERAKLITDTEFDRENHQIVIVANCPRPYKFFGGEFDLREVVKIIQKDVTKELESVQSLLLPWSNLFFLNVTVETRVIKSMEFFNREQYFALWPYLLQNPRSSTEASVAFVQIILFALDIREIDWIQEVKIIIAEIRKLRSLDFMLINLCATIEKLLSQTISTEEIKFHLREYLKLYLETVEKNCSKILDCALEYIVPESILFVFGYSINIEEILRKVTTKVKVIVIDCFEPLASGFLYTENKKILNILTEKSGINREDIQFIQHYSFPHILSNLIKQNKQVTLLLGTHGVLDSKDLLCKVGSELLARCANDYKAQVIALAEKSKFLNTTISQGERDSINDLISTESYINHPDLGVRCVEARMDLVPSHLVNVLITEEGNIAPVKPVANS